MAAVLAVAVVLLVAIGLALLRRADAQRRQAGLPVGRVVYSDTGTWRRVDRPLFSRRHLLAGKPDYLIEQNGSPVPVEVKPGRTAATPYDSDVLQLAAYCLLVEETWGQPPSHGLIRYADRTFTVAYTPAVRERLLATLEAMRRDAVAGDVARSHQQAGRCAACGFRAGCAQSLA